MGSVMIEDRPASATSDGSIRTLPPCCRTSSTERSMLSTVTKVVHAGGPVVGRVGEPHDIAQAYLFLMQEGFTTGQSIVVDGGTVLV